MKEPKYPTAPLDRFTPNPWNPNRQPEWIRTKTKTSLKRYGFKMPLIVRPLGKTGKLQILDGQHRWELGRELGIQEAPYFNVGPVDDSEAKIITQMANRLHGEDEVHKLALLMKELEDDLGRDEILGVLPYTDQDMDKLLASLEPDQDKIPDSKPPPPATVTLAFNLLTADAARVETALEAVAAQAKGDRNRALLLALGMKGGKRRK